MTSLLRGRGRDLLVLLLGLAALIGLSAWHLGQGRADVGLAEVLRGLLGDAPSQARAVAAGSRVPRAAAGVLSGAALGIAGVLLQVVTRNPLAAPGTLGVNAGAHLAVTAVAVAGLELAGLPRVGVAFAGGLAAGALVYAVAGGVGLTPVRLLLAGVAVTLALSAGTGALLLLFEQRTAGLFFWGQGTLVQANADAVTQAWPRVLLGGVLAVVAGRALDVLALGDEAAAGVGLRVTRARLGAGALAVFMAATAVALTGPIGFVGLVAPHVVRLLGVTAHRWLVPAAAVWGAALLVGADAVVRGVRSTALGSELPAGIATALVGAPLFVWLARRVGRESPDLPAEPHTAGTRALSGLPLLGAATALLAAVLVAGLVFGDVVVAPGELIGLLTGDASALARTVVGDLRLPRQLTAALAGASLAVSGALLQAVTRNPLAAPSVLGITGGAGLGALLVLVALPEVPIALLPAAAFAGALAAGGAVYALAWRGGIDPARLLLVGVAVAAFTAALTAAVVVGADVRLAQSLTWLAGSTYARGWDDVAGLAAWPAVLLPLAWLAGRVLDLLILGEDVPRSLGVPLRAARSGLLLLAVLLAAAAVAAVGTMTFVGLVAPHAARLLVGARHRLLLPLAGLLGATLVSAADTIGRVVLAPAQLPSGMVTALVGAPYFVWLLSRSGLRPVTRR